MNQQLRASARILLNQINAHVVELGDLLLEAEALQDKLHYLLKASRTKP